MEKQTKWSIDPSHSEISFKVRHLMISNVKGYFETFEASIYTYGHDFLSAEIDLAIDPSSIITGDAKRDEHLIGPEFFNAEVHKQINFTSSTISPANGNGVHALWGEFTMNGITKNMKFDVTFGGIVKDPWGNEKAGFEVTGLIKRSDFGLVWNAALETGGVMVGDDVHISCQIELLNGGYKEPDLVDNAVLETKLVM